MPSGPRGISTRSRPRRGLWPWEHGAAIGGQHPLARIVAELDTFPIIPGGIVTNYGFLQVLAALTVVLGVGGSIFAVMIQERTPLLVFSGLTIVGIAEYILFRRLARRDRD